MQTTTLKSSDVAPNARVVRILRSPTKIRSQGRRVVPSAAVHKPPGKWTVVAAFVLAVMLHAGAVMWVEIQQEKPPSEADAPFSSIPWRTSKRTPGQVQLARPEQESLPIDAVPAGNLSKESSRRTHSLKLRLRFQRRTDLIVEHFASLKPNRWIARCGK